jgi:hypothetical protein
MSMREFPSSSGLPNSSMFRSSIHTAAPTKMCASPNIADGQRARQTFQDLLSGIGLILGLSKNKPIWSSWRRSSWLLGITYTRFEYVVGGAWSSLGTVWPCLHCTGQMSRGSVSNKRGTSILWKKIVVSLSTRRAQAAVELSWFGGQFVIYIIIGFRFRFGIHWNSLELDLYLFQDDLRRS